VPFLAPPRAAVEDEASDEEDEDEAGLSEAGTWIAWWRPKAAAKPAGSYRAPHSSIADGTVRLRTGLVPFACADVWLPALPKPRAEGSRLSNGKSFARDYFIQVMRLVHNGLAFSRKTHFLLKAVAVYPSRFGAICRLAGSSVCRARSALFLVPRPTCGAVPFLSRRPKPRRSPRSPCRPLRLKEQRPPSLPPRAPQRLRQLRQLRQRQQRQRPRRTSRPRA